QRGITIIYVNPLVCLIGLNCLSNLINPLFYSFFTFRDTGRSNFQIEVYLWFYISGFKMIQYFGKSDYSHIVQNLRSILIVIFATFQFRCSILIYTTITVSGFFKGLIVI